MSWGASPQPYSVNVLSGSVQVRETRKGWPLLTVKTQVNGDSRVQMKGVLPWLVCWACRAGIRDFCSAPVALVGPVQNMFFSPYTVSIPLSTSPSKLGRQPRWVACLLVQYVPLVQLLPSAVQA